MTTMTEAVAVERPHWMNRERLTVYSGMILVCFLAICGYGSFLLHQRGGVHGHPIGDFVVFWAASHIALTGHAADAFDMHTLLMAERIALPHLNKNFAWSYPPTFYLVVLPLSLMPYLLAQTVFSAATLGVYVLALRKIVTGRVAMGCLAAFSGVWVTLWCGQNGFLTAALAGAALLCLPKRQTLAGVFVGLLAVKPHLAILFPVALIAIGAWRAIAAAAVTSVSFTAFGTAVLGRDALTQFFKGLNQARVWLQAGQFPLRKMPSVYALCSLLGAPAKWAFAAHLAVAFVVVGAVWYTWRRSGDWGLRSAMLMTATFLVSPYVYDYDLAWLAFPIAWLSVLGMRDGWMRGEREVLVAAWLLPILMMFAPHTLNLQFGPLVLSAVLLVVLRRVRAGLPIAAPAEETGMPLALAELA